LAKTTNIDFKYEPKRELTHFAIHISTNLHHKFYPPESVISGPSIIEEFDPKSIEDLTELLHYKNYRAFICTQNPNLKNPLTEKYYGMEYEISDLDNDLWEEMETTVKTLPDDITKMLHLPSPNMFIPENLELQNKKRHPDPALKPTLLLKSPKLELWFKQDDRFELPRGILTLGIHLPGIYNSPLEALSSILYCEMVYDQIKKITYDAKTAGFRYSISSATDVIDVVIEGYNDKLADLLTVILENMKNIDVSEERYNVCLDETIRSLENNSHIEPWNQALLNYQFFKTSIRWRYTDNLAAAKKLSIEHMKEFAKKMFQKSYFQILLLGNYKKEDALEISKTIESKFNSEVFPTYERILSRPVQYPTGQYVYCANSSSEKNLNSSVMRVIYAGTPMCRHERAILGLISSIMHEPFFDQIRTKEQLGYIVLSQCNIASDSSMCILLLVQSEASPIYVDLRIKRFIETFSTFIQNITPLQLDTYVRALVNKRTDKPKSMREEALEFWGQIKSKYYEFTWKQADIGYLQALTVKDVVAFWEKYIIPSSEFASHVSIHTYSSFFKVPVKDEVSKYPLTLFALQECLATMGCNNEIISKDQLILFVSSLEKYLDLKSLTPEVVKKVIDSFREWYADKAQALEKNSDSKESENKGQGSNTSKILESLVYNDHPTNHLHKAFLMVLEECTNSLVPEEVQLERTPEPYNVYLLDKSDEEEDIVKEEDTLYHLKIKKKFNISRGLIESPSGPWIFYDPVNFKNTSQLGSGPVPSHPLIPEY
ncbi:hypothetical protein BB560_006278, partial [Smittium megazygosporum]